MGELNINTVIIITVLVTLVFTIIMYVLQSMLRIRKEIYYNEKKNKAEIELMRNGYESKMYDIVERLVSSESRWKDVNHLLISAQEKKEQSTNSSKVQLTEFLSDKGVTEEDLEIEKDLVFVLTPFNDRYNMNYNIIQEVCRESGLRCMRGDEKNVKTDILGHILQQMVKARLIIANIDGRNPNVLYELGIAHAMDKTTILISSSVESLPADIKSIRMIVANNSYDLKSELKYEISKALVST